MEIPRPEYPRPQMVRENWINLNGTWAFAHDPGRSGQARGMAQSAWEGQAITVPFCPESALSGIGNTDFLNAVWYRRSFCIPEGWKGMRILLHFEAVDYQSRVWVNGQLAGDHCGGYTPFCFDITGLLQDGENTLTLYAEDDTRTGRQPAGKQSVEYASAGCCYTRVTGIWQTVWLEAVPPSYIVSYRAVPDVDNQLLHLAVTVKGSGTLYAAARYQGQPAGRASAKGSGTIRLQLPLSALHLWQPLDAKLYDLELSFGDDRVEGYFGMRKLEWEDGAIRINGRPVFQRLVLDQGFYPDGIYTAPTDQALRQDIALSMALGFNGARLHEKLFERRFLYHADHMGYLVWGEYGNWGFDHSRSDSLEIYLPQWMEAVERDWNSPALIGWCPFNETWDFDGRRQNDAMLENVYRMTKRVDDTRPVIDTSGNYHVITDIYDIHDYEQAVEQFAAHYAPMLEGGAPFETFPERQKWSGQPFFVSEYGGIAWQKPGAEGWGYGNAPKSEEEYVRRYTGLCRTLLDNPRICALCYTQLYDVEQEQNGVYYYDRTPKFPPHVMEQLRAAMAAPAAMEQENA